MDRQMQKLVYAAQLKSNISWNSMRRIQRLPNAERTLFRQIKAVEAKSGKYTLRRSTFLPNEFLRWVKKLSHIKHLAIPDLVGRSIDELNTVLVTAINILQNSLEAIAITPSLINVNRDKEEDDVSDFPGDALIEALQKCTHLTAMSMNASYSDNLSGPSEESMIALAKKGQLRRLELINIRRFSSHVYQAFFQHCPLEDVRIHFPSNGLWEVTPSDFDRGNLLKTLIESRREALLRLEYIGFYHGEMVVEDELIHDLVERCPNLELLALEPRQPVQFEKIFPRWKSLKAFQFINFSAEQIVRMTASSPSLQEIYINGGWLKDQLYNSLLLEVWKPLAQLNRPLIVVVGHNVFESDQMQEELKLYPHIKFILDSYGSSFLDFYHDHRLW